MLVGSLVTVPIISNSHSGRAGKKLLVPFFRLFSI